jgi:hypothetical protein
MALEHLSLSDLYLGWTLLFTMVFGTVAFFKAPNDFASIAKYVGLATGMAVFVAAWFAVPMWAVIRIVS